MDTGGEQRVAVIIEDDDDIRHLLDTVLTQAGFQVIATSNGQDGIDAVRRYEPIVTTLDVNMPGMDGFEAARRIRAFSSTYIVMLTALAEEIDTLQGLDAGADDYINKPFRPRELRARIEAMMRRPRAVGVQPAAATTPVATAPSAVPVATPTESGPVITAPIVPEPVAGTPVAPVPMVAPSTEVEPYGAGGQPAGSGWMEHNGLWLNIETRVVKVETKEVDLTRSEFDLLAALMESTRRVRTKADLALLLRGESYVTSHFIGEADKRAIEVHMGNLRKKLADSIAAPRWIETVRGVGYRLTAPDGA
jgi:two-component system OmpR family response regulator